MKFRKLAAAILFTAALMIPTTFGIPLTFMAFSPGVQEAQARQGGAWLREVRINRGRMFWSESGSRVTGRSTASWVSTNFIVIPANRSSVTLTARRESASDRAQVRFRINNGSWTSWSRSNASQRVSVPSNNGNRDRSVRVRIQVRSENRRNTINYNYIIRRASTNTRADRLVVTGGRLSPAFHANRTNYTVNLGWGETGTWVPVRLRFRAAHPHANVAWDRTNMVRRGASNLTFHSWPRNNHWTVRRAGDTRDWVRVGFGEVIRVRFRVMGAYNTMTSGSNNIRTYTVTIRRGPSNFQQIINRYEPRMRAATTGRALEANRSDARRAIWSFQHSRGMTNAEMQPWQTRIDNLFDQLRPGLPH